MKSIPLLSDHDCMIDRGVLIHYIRAYAWDLLVGDRFALIYVIMEDSISFDNISFTLNASLFVLVGRALPR
jgi:hypothetical protein